MVDGFQDGPLIVYNGTMAVGACGGRHCGSKGQLTAVDGAASSLRGQWMWTALEPAVWHCSAWFEGCNRGYGMYAGDRMLGEVSRSSRGRRRWSIHESIHVFNTCIDSHGVNELPCLRYWGVNRGMGTI